MSSDITIKCPAKVNLFLHITGRRDDGYHNIYTLFYPVSIYDTLNIKKSTKTTLTCSNTLIPVDKSNTILKTYNILKEQYNVTDNYEIFLNKKIPNGAGLGGGSSDAAKFLLAVNKLSNLNLSIKEMENIMAQVGSDTGCATTCKRVEYPGVSISGRENDTDQYRKRFLCGMFST